MSACDPRQGLAERLRRATRGVHAAAERAGIMRELLRGTVERERYVRLLRNLYDIYAALESALARARTHPAVAPVYLPGLVRAAALAADLDALHGECWREELAIAAVTAEYADRLDALAANRPELLAAHAYTRYLGDLNGGQVLRRIVADALELRTESGTAFYEFAAIPDLAGAIAEYRAALDALPVDELTAKAIVAEAQHAFALHVRLFEALAAAPPARAEPPSALR